MHRDGDERRLLGCGAGEDGKMTRWGEIKCARCAELEAQITAMEEGLTAVHMSGYMDGQEAANAKLAKQDDLVQAAVAAKLREAAESLHTVVNRKGSNDYRRGHQGYSNGIDACYDAILDLITPDAQAALDRVVAAALREAAQAARLSISEREEWPPKDGDVLVDDCMAAILALIPKGGE